MEIQAAEETHAPPPLPVQPESLWGFWASIGLSALTIVVAFFGTSLLNMGLYALHLTVQGRAIGVGDIERDGVLVIYSVATSAMAVFVLVWCWILLKGARFRQYLRLKLPRLMPMLASIAAVLALSASLDLLGRAIGRPLVPEWMLDVYASASPLPVFALCVIVLAPAYEELLFRGFMYRGVAASPIGPWGACILCALPFALLHQQYDAYDIAQVGILGLAFGCVRHLTQSVSASMIVHGAVNALGLAQTAYVVHTSG